MTIGNCSRKDSTVTLGLFAHLIFNRFEPANLSVLACLLGLVPSLLSILFLVHLAIFKALAFAFLTYYATLALSIVVYRLSPFHPLSNIPGPIPNKISMLWMLWIGLQKKRHVYIKQLHDKYGDIVRIGPNEVSIRDPSAITPLMGANGWPKGPNWTGRTLNNPTASLIAIRDPALHNRRRRPWTRALNTASVKEFQPLIAKRVKQLVDRLEQQSSSKEIDLSQWISYFTYDFMGDMAFGHWSEMLDEGDKDQLWQILKGALKTMSFLEPIPWLAQFILMIPNAGEGMKHMRKFNLARMQDRMHSDVKRKDLFYYIHNEDGAEPQQPPIAQLLADANLAIIAGSDTTSTTLSNIFFSLLRNPGVYKKLQAEVDQWYPQGSDATDPEHHQDMSYLDAVINETLRLFPVVPSGSQRAAVRGSGGKFIGPYYLPEGTQARIHFWSIQRDPRNFFPKSDTFWPERWLIAQGDMPAPDDFRHNFDAFIPFSFGSYNCVGKNLALTEMRTVLCHVLQNLSFRFVDGWDADEWERGLEDNFVIDHGALPVTVTVRSSSRAEDSGYMSR
ncbi:unnamed protein product [Somion occarium]|uniref:Cytochrome P450 n=1 Tax=Somion occarium TaxID=3059160 RepID=A0ABP1DXD3_9APHY